MTGMSSDGDVATLLHGCTTGPDPEDSLRSAWERRTDAQVALEIATLLEARGESQEAHHWYREADPCHPSEAYEFDHHAREGRERTDAIVDAEDDHSQWTQT